MAEKDKQLASLQSLLAANGLIEMGIRPQTSDTPSRKRHSSQQLGGTSKDSRFTNNRFEALMGDEDGDGEFDSFVNHADSRTAKTSTQRQVDYARVQSHPRAQAQQRSPPQTARTHHGVDMNQRHKPTDLGEVIENQVEPEFSLVNNGALRQELEVSLETLNGDKFIGSITPQEAKHAIFKSCLGFSDLTNFDGARVEFRGVPVVIFKLKTAINVDELIDIQNFEFIRKSSRNGRTHIDVIGCKIRGLRSRSTNDRIQTNKESRARQAREQDDGVRTVLVEGCGYRVPKEVIIDFLSIYGTVVSEVVEQLFDDGSDPYSGNDGTNRTGTYAVKVKLRRKIPQLLPMLGKRIKIYYPGIQKLCTNCFGNHPRKVCRSDKLPWPEYVQKFIASNREVPAQLFGKWANERPENTSRRGQWNDDNPEPCSIIDRTPKIVDQCPGTVSLSDEIANKPKSLSETTPANNTEKWVSTLPVTQNLNRASNLQSSSLADQCRKTDTKKEPKASDYKVPYDQLEHDSMVARLVAGGSLESEAEQTIANRKLLFNRAMREYKKLNNYKPQKTTNKKQGKQSKHQQDTTI